MTGSGAVINVARVTADHEILISGLGGVGMGAVMAAKIAGCKTIIAVDRVKARLDFAKELGATHTINTDGAKDLTETLQSATFEVTQGRFGVDVVVDTTAFVPLIDAEFASIRHGGQLLLIGIPKANDIYPVNLSKLLARALTVRAVMMGDAVPKEYVPKMVQWYHEGKFPVDKLIGYFDAEKINDAVKAMLDATVIKPVLVW